MQDGERAGLTRHAPSILIVEDDPIISWATSVALSNAGYDVCGIASNAAAATELLGIATPDLILMDVTIKGDIDGIQLAHAFRDAGSKARIIFITASDAADTAHRIAAFHPDGYLRKPVTPQELQVAIQAVFGT